MSRPIISVENLGKKYRIQHQGQRQRYVALRDVIAQKFAAPFKFLRSSPLRPGRGQGEVLNSQSPNSQLPTSRATREDFWALRDVSFEIKQGEVVGIIGRNGAGKTTLLKILSRITEPTEGRVEITGRVASLLEVGTGFHPELTGRENVFLNGAILGMTRAEIKKKFDEIVAFAEVENFLDTPVKRYSSGMYVRLAFAVAAHLDPEILIVDEVLAVGDAQFQKKCLGKMGEVAKGGRTVLFVSHSMPMICQLCERVLLIRSGRIDGDGNPDEMIKLYLSDAQKGSKVSLRDWHDRINSGQGRICDFEIRNDKGEPTDFIRLGSAIVFRMAVEFSAPVVSPCFGIIVQAAGGERVLDLRSYGVGARIGRAFGEVVVEVRVDRLGLYPGDYLLSPWVYDTASKTDVDWAHACCTLTVSPEITEDSQRHLDPRWGKYWVPQEWRVLTMRPQ